MTTQSHDTRKLTFKRSFSIIFALIVLNQAFSLVLALHYGFDIDVYPPEFYLVTEIGGVIWFIMLAATVTYDLHHHDMSIGGVFNFDLSVLRSYSGKTLKYFLGCAIFVVAMSSVNSETELQLQNQSLLTLIMTFLTTVIMAPIVEEMAFRGYLYQSMYETFTRKKERLVVNAMLFSAAHVFLVQFLIGATVPYYIFVLGYLLALLYEESRSILPCISLHGLNNVLVFAIDSIKTIYFT